ncbi:MAG TPA: GlsB/YeaQ/YmgE family stress response membrane protein [Terriglobia bacterium]|nr:GlsB/YeaQ/YmgE family stress response membrane protein [Terriglobia bacterium]
MEAITWVMFVIIGFIAGVIGKGQHAGSLRAIVAAILGAVVGGGVLSWLGVLSDVAGRVGLGDFEIVVSLMMAGVGAVLFMGILPLLSRKGLHD